MGSHSFGSLFRITTWGESHGPAVGVVIDGCPAGLELSVQDLIPDLKRRAPGQKLTSPRKEDDEPEILSGVFNGVTTGAPISILIRNQNQNSQAYKALENILRPGHAGFTYLAKFGIFDHRGGGRSSARETVCRVAAGAVAKKLLKQFNVTCDAYLAQVGSATTPEEIVTLIEEVQASGDSIGGVVEFKTSKLPVGLGDPVYEKLEANLAKALLSLPATKGFEIGEGFQAAKMRGSEHNDSFVAVEGIIEPGSNHAGGTLGGISTGLPVIGRVVFKPTSSIKKPQETVTLGGSRTLLQLGDDARHDPCVAVRAVPVVEAMVALVLADALLLNRISKL
ncbi:MAG: chorismate synthase [Rhabdochlamydiaceae bacterium]|nr:chorismate synthase [Rhabdochlamydiaceae bacterium]